MKLRTWQQECILQAILQYQTGMSHFLCLATPGAGKTLMASRLAKQLIDDNLIDLVICITPSLIVSEDFRTELEIQLGNKLDGKLGSIGRTLTYHAMLNENHIWDLFEDYRVFVIFDEIHHCAGSELQNSNAWGQKIIFEIQGRATYTLALTGTPWRSDNTPIALGRYLEDGMVHCDYSYGLTQAIKDKVCRTPSITLFDNDNITLTESGDITQFNSFENLFNDSNCNYQSLIESESLINYMLDKANKKLNSLRKLDSSSGGLIVATSVAHAKSIHYILKQNLNEDADIVTYLEPDSVASIKRFKYSNTKWIISVGMISEGTNIPRLKICCYLTRVKTELYFRQVLGRILRANGSDNELGYFYMPAEPTLTEYAYRVSEDIPAENIVKFDTVPLGDNTNAGTSREKLLTSLKASPLLELNVVESFTYNATPEFSSDLSRDYEYSLGLFGQFKQKVLTINKIKIQTKQT
jgi:superfamily II DNA or RNA helicase